jgi:hypothetical protein
MAEAMDICTDGFKNNAQTQPDSSSQSDPPGQTAEGDRVNARDSSQPTQVLLGSPPSAGGAFGGEGGCCVEAGAELLKISAETMRSLLQNKWRAMGADTMLCTVDSVGGC